MSTAALRSPAISRAAASPSTPGMRMSRMARSGLCSLTSAMASSPRPVSPTTSYPCSCRISLRSRRMMASSSAMTTRTATQACSFAFFGLSGLEDEAVEQLVLFLFELRNPGDYVVAAADHGVGVPLGLVVLAVGQRGLRHQRPQAGIVGLLHEDGQLLVQDSEFVAGAPQAVVDLPQPALDQ